MSARITATIIASGEPITVKLDTAARGPAGSAGPNAVTSATTSDGTANLSVATISSQGAVLVNPEFDNGIIADDNGGYSRLRVGNIIMSSAEGSVDCGQVDTETVNTTTLRVSSTEYLSGASFTYGTGAADAHLTALGAGATGVDVFKAATQGDARDAMGLGTGDSPTFANLTTANNSECTFPAGFRDSGSLNGSINAHRTSGLVGTQINSRRSVSINLDWDNNSDAEKFAIFSNVFGGSTGELFAVPEVGPVTALNGISTSNLTASGDIEGTDATKGVILKSPNGTRYRITVENDGTLTTTEVSP
jgi:hypothetical protein